jgi:hypothetical protein
MRVQEPDGYELSPSSARSKQAMPLAAEEEDRVDIEYADHHHDDRRLAYLRSKAYWPIARQALEANCRRQVTIRTHGLTNQPR